MPSRYELRETGTGRRLGTIDLVDVLPPGGVVQLFQSGLVQVEDPAPAEPESATKLPSGLAGVAPRSEPPANRKSRRATA